MVCKTLPTDADTFEVEACETWPFLSSFYALPLSANCNVVDCPGHRMSLNNTNGKDSILSSPSSSSPFNTCLVVSMVSISHDLSVLFEVDALVCKCLSCKQWSLGGGLDRNDWHELYTSHARIMLFFCLKRTIKMRKKVRASLFYFDDELGKGVF